MKNIKYILTTLLVAFILVSCETYDDVENRGLVNVGISSGDSNVPPVPENGGGTRERELQIFISSPAPTDLTFNLSVDTLNTVVSPENYTLPPTITIPAGERIGTAIITFVNFNLTVDREPLVVLLSGPDNFVYGLTSVLYTVKRTGT